MQGMEMGDLLQEAQQAGLFDGPLSSCEKELQELLHQIDIMLGNKHEEWATEKESLKLKCQAREHEATSFKTKVEASQRQVAELRHQIEGMANAQRTLVTDYEQQLSQLRSQLSNLQSDYERVQKRHSKQSSNAEKARDQTLVQLHDTQAELLAARNQLQDYESKMRDWEIERRAHRQQAEALESQRTTLAEKCELSQQQSLGYQEQLGKRRQMLEQSELNFKSRQMHLEGQLLRAQDALEGKSATIQDLEERLRDAKGGNEQVEEEYNHANKQLQMLDKSNRDLENELSQLQIELQSRDDLVAATEQDVRQRNRDIARLEEILLDKDNVIRTLENNAQEDESTSVNQLKQQLKYLQDEAIQLRQNELHWRQEGERLQKRLDNSHIECANLNTELEHKIGELRYMEGTELRTLAEDAIKARSQQQEITERHQAEMGGMKKEITALTSDLHQRDSDVVSLNKRLLDTEQQLRNATHQNNRHADELELTKTRVEALRLENRNLQEVHTLDVSSTSRDLQQAEIQLQELQEMHMQHVQSSKILEVDNNKLKQELSSVRQQLRALHSPRRSTVDEQQSSDSLLDTSMSKDRKLQEMESKHRKEVNRLQDRLDTAIRRYDGEVGRLREEQERLRRELKDKTLAVKRLQAENSAMNSFVSSAETITKSPPSKSSLNTSAFSNGGSLSSSVRSPSARQLFRPLQDEETVGRQGSPRHSRSFSEMFLSTTSPNLSQSDIERPNSRASITANFVADDAHRRRELEQLLDSRMTELEQRTDETVQKHFQHLAS